MRSVLGCLSWYAGQLAMDLCAATSRLQSEVKSATVTDLIDVNKLLKKAKLRKEAPMIIHALPPQEMMVATWVDAAHANRSDGGSTAGVLVGCTTKSLLAGELERVNPIFWRSGRTTRVCRSSASAETLAATDGEDEMFAIKFQVSEFLGHQADIWNCNETVKKVPGVLVSDSKNLFDRLSTTVLTLTERRSGPTSRLSA